MIWPEAGGERAAASAAAEVTLLLDHLADAYPKFLVIALHDLPRDLSLHEESPRLEPFEFVLAASTDPAAQDVVDTLHSALSELEIDLRVPEFRTQPLPPLPPALAEALDGRDGISVLSLGIPQIHRIPGDPRRIYPQIYHQVESAIHDALLQAAARGHTAIVDLLLQHRAKVNVAASDGSTALLKAVANGHWQIINMLLDAGASTNVTMHNGITLAAIAAHSKDPRIRERIAIAVRMERAGHAPVAKDDPDQ